MPLVVAAASSSSGNYSMARTHVTNFNNNKICHPILSTAKMKWTCELCGKKLCSKRSYDEHFNVHTNMRPFACKYCNYAAASQMTLRRHNLRNHIPRQAWGYQCPYCSEMYMEPASYQQHIVSHHIGLSATFGCPLRRCTFTTCSSVFFRDHLEKHSNISPDVYEEANYRLFRFAVDDKFGVGYGRRSIDIRRMEVLQELESLRNDKEYMKTPLVTRKVKRSKKVNVAEVKASIVSKPVSQSQQQQQHQQQLFEPEELDFLNADIDCAEVVINNFADCLHEGMVEPELD